jgi:hypothetical protein
MVMPAGTSSWSLTMHSVIYAAAAFGPTHCRQLEVSPTTFSNANRPPTSGPFQYTEAGGGYVTGKGNKEVQ